MKQVVMGTAGHIDHGKTQLIKTLTGIDTDRLKEEKERGGENHDGTREAGCDDGSGERTDAEEDGDQGSRSALQRRFGETEGRLQGTRQEDELQGTQGGRGGVFKRGRVFLDRNIS